MRFRRVPVQIADEVPESSGAESWWGSGTKGSGGFRQGWLMRFWRVRAQVGNKVPEGCYRWLMKFRRVAVQLAHKFAEGSGADGWWSFGGFGRRWQPKFRRVPMQIADEVSNGLVQGSGGFRMADEVRKVPVQTADKVAEVSGADSRRSTGGFRYKNLPKSSKPLGITHEFIFPQTGRIWDQWRFACRWRKRDRACSRCNRDTVAIRWDKEAMPPGKLWGPWVRRWVA